MQKGIERISGSCLGPRCTPWSNTVIRTPLRKPVLQPHRWECCRTRGRDNYSAPTTAIRSDALKTRVPHLRPARGEGPALSARTATRWTRHRVPACSICSATLPSGCALKRSAGKPKFNFSGCSHTLHSPSEQHSQGRKKKNSPAKATWKAQRGTAHGQGRCLASAVANASARLPARGGVQAPLQQPRCTDAHSSGQVWLRASTSFQRLARASGEEIGSRTAQLTSCVE